MYPLLLILTAAFLISIVSTNWPGKLYHDHVMKKIGAGLGVEWIRKGFFFGGVSSEIRTIIAGNELRIRFIEGSADSLYAHSGLEIRYPLHHAIILHCNRSDSGIRPWGDFQRVLTGETAIDAQWVILSNQPETVGLFWQSSPLKPLLAVQRIEQILVQPGEMIVRLKKGAGVRTVMEVVSCINENNTANSMLIDK